MKTKTIIDPNSGLSYKFDGVESDKPPLVLIHGVGNTHDSWDEVAKILSSEFRILRYDIRGHGRSKKPKTPYHLEDFVEDHITLMESLGITKAHLAGFSLGGLIAQKIAILDSEQIDKLMIFGAVAGRTSEEQERVMQRLKFAEEHGPVKIAESSVERWFTQEFRNSNPERVKQKAIDFAKNDPQSYAAAYRVLATSDLVEDLSNIKNRTLVLTGEYDVGSPPRMARLMAGYIPNAKCVIIPDMKHSPLIEVPEIVAAEMKNFLTEDCHEAAESFYST